jgi:hypothetical protein
MNRLGCAMEIVGHVQHPEAPGLAVQMQMAGVPGGVGSVCSQIVVKTAPVVSTAKHTKYARRETPRQQTPTRHWGSFLCILRKAVALTWDVRWDNFKQQPC